MWNRVISTNSMRCSNPHCCRSCRRISPKSFTRSTTFRSKCLPTVIRTTVSLIYSVLVDIISSDFFFLVNLNRSDDEMMDEVKCSGCDKESDSCRCQELVCAFNKTNQYLYNMNLLDRLAGYTLTNLIQERINTHVQDTCKGIFDMPHIDNLLQWLDTIVLNWLTRIYNQGSLKIDPHNFKIRKVLREFRIKLEYYLYDTYAHIIIEQFFNIIIGEFVYSH